MVWQAMVNKESARGDVRSSTDWQRARTLQLFVCVEDPDHGHGADGDAFTTLEGPRGGGGLFHTHVGLARLGGAVAWPPMRAIYL